MQRKWWQEMFIPEKGLTEGIVSKNKPVQYTDDKKKISLYRGIKKEEYDEVCDFIRSQNKMSSGNYTLLTKGELDRYIRLGARIVLLRGGNKNSLLGTILSLPLPVKCTLPIGNIPYNDYKTLDLLKDNVIIHGCTTFLNIHKMLRNNGLCMSLIRELIEWGYEDGIYCDYHMTTQKLYEKSFQVSAWFRPLNLPKSIGLGFLIPNWNVPTEFAKNRLKYNTKHPTKFKTVRVRNKNQKKALHFYQDNISDKMFVFWPDMDIFSRWIQEFPTFMVKEKDTKKIVGIYSIKPLFCRMDEIVNGKLCLPLFFNCLEEYGNEVMRSLIHTAKERDFDTLYVYETGDVTRKVLESVNAIETKDKSWVSLYNNSILLSSENISVPLI